MYEANAYFEEYNETPSISNECFYDRELSWLQFNLRVLGEAENNELPLQERLKFMSIYYSNLDEFFMVRVGSITHRGMLMPYYTDAKTGWDTDTQLKKILGAVKKQQKKAEKVYSDIINSFREQGVDIVDTDSMSKGEEAFCRKIFSEIKETITTNTVKMRSPFPDLQNKETYLVCILGKPETPEFGICNLSRLPVYKSFDLGGRKKLVNTSKLVDRYAGELFKKKDVKEHFLIRITQNADVLLDEDMEYYSTDFRRSMTEYLKKRKKQRPVRLQICGNISEKGMTIIRKRISLEERSVFCSKMPFETNFGGYLKKKAFKSEKQMPVNSSELKRGEYLSYLEKRDILLSFPYQSIEPFIDVLYEAADCPDTEEIKITLYRLAKKSRIAEALKYAAQKGKKVLCLLELRARFDEQNNIDYSEELEKAGCKVIYGLPNYKVHSKICLITINRNGRKNFVTQIGTGNYNEVTCENYCDLSLITSDEEIGKDAEMIFSSLENGEIPPLTQKLWAAPLGYKKKVLEFLDGEIQKGTEGYAAIKVNSLNDMDVMQKISEASCAGVKIELFVRGICCIKPGIEGLTENVSVKSVVGRHLEHSRIFIFGKGENSRIFIGSGDLLNRNTRRRVEIFAPIEKEEIKEQVEEVMNAFRDDDVKGRVMHSNGRYYKSKKPKGEDSQQRLQRYFADKSISEKI